VKYAYADSVVYPWLIITLLVANLSFFIHSKSVGAFWETHDGSDYTIVVIILLNQLYDNCSWTLLLALYSRTLWILQWSLILPASSYLQLAPMYVRICDVMCCSEHYSSALFFLEKSNGDCTGM